MNRTLIIWVVGIAAIGAPAADSYFFFDLKVRGEGDQLALEWSPQRLMRYEQLKDERYDFSGFTPISLDHYLQMAALMSKALDAYRDGFKIKEDKPFLVAELIFTFTLRKMNGEALDRDSMLVGFHITQQQGVVQVSMGETKKMFDIEAIQDEKGYMELIGAIGEAVSALRFDVPKQNRFVVESYYSCSDITKDLFEDFEPDDATRKAYRALYIAHEYSQQEHLATTLVSREKDGLKQVPSGHLHALRRSISLYATALDKKSRGENIIHELETYLAVNVSDVKAIEMLVDAYVAAGRDDDALNLITKRRIYFDKDSHVVGVQRKLIRKREARRDNLLAKRKEFDRDENVKLTIVSPQPNDFLGGDARMVFDMEGASSEPLRMDVMIDDDILGSIYEEPFVIPFKLKPDRGRAYLKLATYFKNRTYQSTYVTVKPLYIADETEVNLATLRVSATQGRDYLLNLRPIDFSISEADVAREIFNFRKDEAPLRVGILVDTSISMTGEKLYRAQTAINTFLGLLNYDDLASIYTFDQNVMKLSRFTNQFSQMQDVLNTLSPHHSTSLYDALAAAEADLGEMDGNRVIIVVSDGRDSASNVSRRQVETLFRKSSTMVYSIVLNLDNIRNREGKAFMREIARMSGSASLEVNSVENLTDSFRKVYNELRSFYLMDYYSLQKNFDLGKVTVRVRKNGAQTRFSRQRSEAAWQ